MLELLELLDDLPIDTDVETARISGLVFRMAEAHRLTMYDAIYLDLASRRGIGLATRDNQLRRAAVALNVALIKA